MSATTTHTTNTTNAAGFPPAPPEAHQGAGIHDSRQIVAWVALLPEVGDPILSRRAAIIKMVDEAAKLEAQAAELRSQAYFASLSLEADARRLWADEEIQRAKDRTK
ncbi:MAG: hypothetical protein C0607_02830 [Azoarcus sp.]|nr:MAG: hypothetical protein C0607_02830 [Azoarcus sp.]TVT57565.1 MAG: hypothetical protein FHK80_08625 [Azoarcus sp. PHD]